MTYSAIIFDCDGTLVDSEPIACAEICRAVAELGLHIGLEDALATFVGHKDAECMLEIERRLGRPLPANFSAALRLRTAEAFRRDLSAVVGARDLVASITVPRCVASSGPRDKIELSLGLTGLLPYFGEHVYSAYEIGAWKPDPTLFLHAAAALGVAPASCAVVEDSDPGIEAGLAAGMSVFAYRPCGRSVPDGVTAVETLADLGPLLGAATMN